MNLTGVRNRNLTGKGNVGKGESYLSTFPIGGKKVRNPLGGGPTGLGEGKKPLLSLRWEA